ncbi:MAG: glycosyl transferase / lysophospholipid acyltransferase [Proteobacteria bacterium]|nr:glycosyl transferase / lysophospholipid acyltransferase [Pseudomonadota bacterium]
MKICALIPVYNHEHAVGMVVQQVLAQGLPCVLVDDGSDTPCRQVLEQLQAEYPEIVTLRRLPVNQGKGGAVLAGMQAAHEAGFTHALQIDADGQHDTGAIADFVAASRAEPAAVICGYPLYDASVPRARLYGRYATHVWVWINTLSLRIRDSMCGFRLYPLAATLAVAENGHIGRRMDFDTEILVRMDWAGIRIVNRPTRVHYPLDGVSHFDALHDNLRISLMHTRLFFGMLPRSPRLLWRLLRGEA